LIPQLKHLFYHFISMIGPDGLPVGDAGLSGTSDYSYEEDGSSPPAVNSRHPTGFSLIDNPSIVAPQPDHRFTLIDHILCIIGDALRDLRNEKRFIAGNCRYVLCFVCFAEASCPLM
jgi:hypothetical protein